VLVALASVGSRVVPVVALVPVALVPVVAPVPVALVPCSFPAGMSKTQVPFAQYAGVRAVTTKAPGDEGTLQTSSGGPAERHARLGSSVRKPSSGPGEGAMGESAEGFAGVSVTSVPS
jgi:hypothetical protein